MKFLAVFAALVAVAASHSTWTLPQLSEAIQNPNTDPALLPYLEQALDNLMDSIYAGSTIETVAVTIPAVDLSTWTLNELSEALQNPATDAALIPYLEQALNQMMDAIVSEQPIAVAPVAIPAMDVTSWTLNELSEALDDPATNPALIPYLEHALNEIMDALMSGQQMEAIAIAIPSGLVPVIGVDAVVVPAPVEAPVVPSPAASASPLVQIIINVNQQEAIAVAPVAVAQPEITPEPVHVVEQAPISAEPIQVVEVAPVPAEPVQVVEQAPTPVEPVQVVEQAPVASMPIGVVVPAPAA